LIRENGQAGTDMGNRKIYIGLSVVVFLVLIGLHQFGAVNYKRHQQQHEYYNIDIEDTNPSIDADSFSSRLPIISIDTHGQTIPGKPPPGTDLTKFKDTRITVDVQVFQNDNALNTLTSPVGIDSKAEIRVHGHSSRFFDKTNFLVKSKNDDGSWARQELMGMNRGDTWVLHGPFLDKTLIRNYMMYNISDMIMNWAPDARFCEIFIDGKYQGLYVAIEQINISAERINVTRYRGDAAYTSYIAEANRPNIYDTNAIVTFTQYTRRYEGAMTVNYPGSQTLTQPLMDHVEDDFSAFEKAIYSYDYHSARFGYGAHIDVSSFVDYFIINEVTENTDAGLYSTYFYKDVRGDLQLAVWDFNNSVNNYMEGPTRFTQFFIPEQAWFYMISKDPHFIDAVIARYKVLRLSVLSDAFIEDYIESVTDYLGIAIDRNFKVWGHSFEPQNNLLADHEANQYIQSYADAVNMYQTRLINKLQWLDENIESLKYYSHPSINKAYNQ